MDWTDAAALADMAGEQEMLALPVRVVDAHGEPVARAKVTPWALQCSLRHGWWSKEPADNAFRISAMPVGENSLLLVKLDADQGLR